MIRKLAERHVEQLTILPTPNSVSESPKDDGKGTAASVLIGAATVEEQLAATPELRLHIRTADIDRWLTLADPPEEEGFAYGLEGASSFDRAPFADIWGRLRLLHIDLDSGVSSN